jgi:phosphomannomutase/phosphoglucomutase
MITGSHNPKNYNGVKLVINDKPVSGSEIYDLINEDKGFLKKLEVMYKDIKEEYIEEVKENIE